MLRVTIDPFRSDKNLEVAEQVSDDKKDQNDAGDPYDHFFPNRRAIKDHENIHAKICAPDERRVGLRLWTPLGASRPQQEAAVFQPPDVSARSSTFPGRAVKQRSYG